MRKLKRWLKENVLWFRVSNDELNKVYYLTIYSFKDNKNYYHSVPYRAKDSFIEKLKETIRQETRGIN